MLAREAMDELHRLVLGGRGVGDLVRVQTEVELRNQMRP